VDTVNSEVVVAKMGLMAQLLDKRKVPPPPFGHLPRFAH
jgi:hypothetical protein